MVIRTISEDVEFPEKAIHDCLAKLSWKLLKKELDKLAWHRNPSKLIDVIMRCDYLVNRRANVEKSKKRMS